MHRREKSKGQQRGAVMVIALVVVTAVSLMAIASMQDVNTQSSMVRNEQLYTNAYQVAISEINAQLGGINLNESNVIDALVLTLLNQPVTQHTAQAMLGPDAGGGAYDQILTIATTCEIDWCVSPPGYSLDGSTRVLQAEINSSASFPGSASQSNQTQGFWYLLPSSGGTTW